jgi:hypothetical protein
VGRFYSISLDIQLLLGLILYFFLSDLTKVVLSNFSAAMSAHEPRFFGIEHVFFMVLAVILAHVGVAAAKRVDDAVAKHRRTAIWFSLSMVAILLGMPWFRPLLPGF